MNSTNSSLTLVLNFCYAKKNVFGLNRMGHLYLFLRSLFFAPYIIQYSH
jgi:hypothetical protein